MEIKRIEIKSFAGDPVYINPTFCYGCGQQICIWQVPYYIFNGKGFCSMDCVEDHVKHFYEKAALDRLWVIDDDRKERWEAARNRYQYMKSL